jgi:hypothetical protein
MLPAAHMSACSHFYASYISGQDSSVSIVSSLRAGRPGSLHSSGAELWMGYEGQPSILSSLYQRFFPLGKANESWTWPISFERQDKKYVNLYLRNKNFIFGFVRNPEVRTIKGTVASWISNYYLSKNRIASVQSNWALHKYARGQYVLNWCHI